MDIFSYFKDDLDKVLTLFVPLLRHLYEDDSIAFKVCTSLPLLPSCVANIALLYFNFFRLSFGCIILEWRRFMLSG